MKRILVTIILVLMFALLAVGPAAAQNGKININGEVTAVGTNTLTVLSKKGETFVVTVPGGFAMNTPPRQGLARLCQPCPCLPCSEFGIWRGPFVLLLESCFVGLSIQVDGFLE